MQEFDVNFKEFNIAFVGLKFGHHAFEYRLDSHFFDKFEQSPLHNADLTVKLDFVKNERLFELKFYLSGIIKTECDRCLAMIDYPISSEYAVIVKLQANTAQNHNRNDLDDLDIVYISPEATHINVAHLIYEFAVLSMPVMAAMPLDAFGNPNCPPDSEGSKPCNEKVLSVLMYDDLNSDADENNDNEDNSDNDSFIDPRWAALWKLKD